MYLKIFIIFLLAIFLQINIRAQTDGGTVVVEMDEISIVPEYNFANDAEREEYCVLKDDLYKIYPLLVLVEDEYERINKEMMLYNDKRRKKFLKWYKNYAKEHYKHHLSGLNPRQGRLLIKMISRQIGDNPYDLIKEYLNGFHATFWQLTSHVFMANLRIDYLPEENPMIEHIMAELEGVSSTSLN